MADDHADVLQQFLSITGSDEGVALNVLENTNWSLEDAVNLFFATGGEGLGGGGGGGARAGGAGAGAGGTGTAGGGGSGGGVGVGGVIGPGDYEDEVRAADPVKRERLYGDPHGVPHHHAAAGAMAGGPMPMGGRFAGQPGMHGPEPGYVDAFRDFEAEARRAGAGGSGGGGTPATGGAAGAGGSGAAAGGGLSDLFKPPEKILFKGPLEAAKAAANSQGRWLLVNVQGSSEFASHRLNRDTWSEALVQDMLQGMFVFWQAQDITPQGEAAIRAYHLHTLPAILIVDPITGSKIWERTGFVAPDTLVEELVPFMDAGPADPAASKLAQQAAASLMGKRKAAGPPAAARTEDEELALALAMSAEEGAGGRGGAGGSGAGAGAMDEDGEEDAEEEARVYAQIEEMRRREAAQRAAPAAAAAAPAAAGAGTGAGAAAAAARQAAPKAAAAPAAAPAAPAVDPAEAQAKAAARVPDEPPEGSGIRVAVRLPEGGRAQRRFAGGDSVAALQDWVASISPEAAVRPFVLSQMGPGAAVLVDAAAKLQDSNVAGAMLVLRWSD